ncbi:MULTISPECIES: hypothetical protein [unclassified Pseudoalteromonas]|uniref:hypothetical protein n=1 Tax=unclassified Pseudoalteromonas TaxID=194690 RepID=UPI000CF64249|nr:MULTISPECIES: hypothetical protein [unclassified Pseudoalteromonas]MBS3796299.1 hypothetical protein [Pseudoalteromonas sp. BDTF-M6]
MSINKKMTTLQDRDAQQLQEVQLQLDSIQDAGVTPQYLRYVLFQKMLDVYQVPKDHAMRANSTPERLDDPGLISQLTELGFAKAKTYH